MNNKNNRKPKGVEIRKQNLIIKFFQLAKSIYRSSWKGIIGVIMYRRVLRVVYFGICRICSNTEAE